MTKSPLTFPSPRTAGGCIRPDTRAALLSALEDTPPLTRRRLEALTSLSPVTLRHACDALCREGILIRTVGHDPESGHVCDLISPVRAPILPLVELTDTHLLWRLFNTQCEPVAAAWRERSTVHTLEDDFECLFGRIGALYTGSDVLASAPPPCAPVLLLPAASQEVARADILIRRIWGYPPMLTLNPAEAMGQELVFHPVTKEDTCLLHLHIGTKASGTLLVRSDRTSPFTPSLHTTELSTVLAAYVGDALPLSSPHTEGLAAFLADLCRFASLDRVVLELPAHADEASRAAVETVCHIGGRPPLTCPTSLGSPTPAHRGAIRLLRRTIWASWGENSANCSKM